MPSKHCRVFSMLIRTQRPPQVENVCGCVVWESCTKKLRKLKATFFFCLDSDSKSVRYPAAARPAVQKKRKKKEAKQTCVSTSLCTLVAPTLTDNNAQTLYLFVSCVSLRRVRLATHTLQDARVSRSLSPRLADKLAQKYRCSN